MAETQTGRDATVYSAGTTANLGEDRRSSALVLPLPSFGFAGEETPGPGGERYWPEKLCRRVIWPPAASGSLYPALLVFFFFWTISWLQCGIEPLTVTSPDNGRKPYGAPSVLRRGKAGVSSLKGQKPDITLRSSDTLPDGSNDIHGAGGIYQITSCRFLSTVTPLQQQQSFPEGFHLFIFFSFACIDVSVLLHFQYCIILPDKPNVGTRPVSQSF